MADYASLTHLHIRNILTTYLRPDGDRPLRVLDLGSGNAVMTTYLQDSLSKSGLNVELFGLDVDDMHVQGLGFHSRSVRDALTRSPDYPWDQRLVLTQSGGAWPFPEGYFDAIVSNQVMEHIQDLDHVFRETARTMNGTGISVHLFPFANYVLEGHTNVPGAHWIRDSSLRASWMKLYYALQRAAHRGKYYSEAQERVWNLDRYSQAHSDYLVTETHYRRFRAYADLAARYGLRVSLDHTVDFYSLKAAQALRRRMPERYERPGAGVTLLGHALTVVSGVSVSIRHADAYPEWRVGVQAQ